jgi:hypothetical protein
MSDYDIHSCGYYCDRPACIEVQRNQLRNKLLEKKEWVGLTDEEILADDVLRYHFALNGGVGPISKKGLAIIAAVNAKLKEKNT